jgi:tRNA G18 (ribose-2'-O)-methylase SpoU
MNTAGEQLDGQTLYERQKSLRMTYASRPGPTVVAIDLQVPDNIGSVLRIADAAACERVIFVGTSDIDLNKVHKTARNCESLVNWTTTTHEQFIRESANHAPLVAVEITTKSTDLFTSELPDPCTLVIGGERHGVPVDILDLCDAAVHIPMYGVNGSMNVTHALAIALFEWRRQHAGQPLPT